MQPSKVQIQKLTSESSELKAIGKEQPYSLTFFSKFGKRWMRSIRVYKIRYFGCW